MERTIESTADTHNGQLQRTQGCCGEYSRTFTQREHSHNDNYSTAPHPALASPGRRLSTIICRLSFADYHSRRLRPRTEQRGRERSSGPGCTARRGLATHAPLTHAPRNKRRSHWPGRVSPRHSARGAVFRLPRRSARGGVFRPRCLARPRTLIGGPPRPAY